MTSRATRELTVRQMRASLQSMDSQKSAEIAALLAEARRLAPAAVRELRQRVQRREARSLREQLVRAEVRLIGGQ